MNQRMLFILLATGVMAAVQGWIIGEVDLNIPADDYRITLAEASALGHVIWIDARKAESYKTEHYPGAVHLSEDDWDTGLNQLLTVWDFEQPMVVYCDGGNCASSREYAQRLREQVDTELVYWLQDGWQALEEAVKK